jgi:hypothetical protein
MPPDTVPLMILANSWATTPEALTAELGDAVIVTDALRIQHVPVTAALAALAKRDAQAARRRAADEKRNTEMATASAAQQRRIQAIQAQQHAQRANGDIDRDTPAFAAMAMGDTNERLSASAERFEDMLGASRAGHYGTFHKLNPKEA